MSNMQLWPTAGFPLRLMRSNTAAKPAASCIALMRAALASASNCSACWGVARTSTMYLLSGSCRTWVCSRHETVSELLVMIHTAIVESGGSVGAVVMQSS
eukprot:GHUV01031558.1.p2 GENE.GHUV01031558.1~~GHUV01031558.1.p2  ORF type:complete len:100 (+),score=14.87 GHUV01031558.1:580-879(+)